MTGGFLSLRNFNVAISVSPHVCFIFCFGSLVVLDVVFRYLS